ncbi:MAG: hypothetical protein HC845_00625 [Akkermansiaceae bacterium]|nr:hypothetical protein [Akkermansiaceae bacterium]
MRFYIFLSGFLLLAMGGAGLLILEKPHSIGFLQGALTLGGGFFICGIFSIKMQLHGFIGSGILALLGAARGLGNLPGLLKFFSGERPRGTAPLLELGVTLICLLLLLKVMRTLSIARLRQMLDSQE